MLRTCRQCRESFEVTEEDLAFLNTLSPIIGGQKQQLPPPTLCPDCRAQRRLSFRNERCFYHRKCDLTGRQIISVYSPDKPHCVYDQREWWSDRWDPLSYGRDFDFSQPFFPQFAALHREVPQMNLINAGNENAEYCHLTAHNRNCYLIVESSHNEDCLFCYWIQKCRDCCDVSFSHECEHCFEVDNCYGCYDLRWSRNCTSCSSGAFLLDCTGCRNCLFCANLRQKEYCILNEQLTKEEYGRRLRDCHFGSHAALEAMRGEFEGLRLKQPHRAAHVVNAENCRGDYIRDSKNCYECFHAYDAQDCRYAEHVWRDAKTCMDVSTAGIGADHIYETINAGLSNSRILFSIQCWNGSSDLLYCYGCCSCTDCFGCVSLRHKRHCILNRQYTEEEYEDLVPRIIAKMRSTPLRSPAGSSAGQACEWGEFFPIAMSPFGYNETVAQELFPLTRKEAEAEGWKWYEERDKQETYLGPPVSVPDRIDAVGDDLCEKILLCEVTGKPYKIIPQELKFYRAMGIPVPRRCPDQRHKERLAQRNPRKLWDRQCAKCQKAIKTTYQPSRPEIVYCETCYLREVY